ncbi:methyltransferase family protein [Maribacter algicola]|uniref:Methyltransferase family protein n=1 Tax=Meishania litoralis TaxID=3434685 RepID=A0ACC7LL08_9FLAO
MELKIPPAVIFIIFAFGMYLLDKFFPLGDFHFFGRIYLGSFLFFSGILVGVVSLIQFFASKTTADPTRPEKAAKLVTRGVYTYTRNPMYLAMLLVLLGLGIHLGNAFNVLLAASFVSYMNRFQIQPEERALSKKFGKDYQQYCTQVRRWF